MTIAISNVDQRDVPLVPPICTNVLQAAIAMVTTTCLDDIEDSIQGAEPTLLIGALVAIGQLLARESPTVLPRLALALEVLRR